jgi:hypothetical protein
MKMCAFLLSIVCLLPGVAFAGPAQQVATEFNIGSSPVDVATLPGDRVVATLLDPGGTTVSWVDTADFDAGVFTVSVDQDAPACLASGTLDDAPVLFVGGDQLDVVRFDTSITPVATASVDASVGLGVDPSALVGMAYDDANDLLFAIDAQNNTLRCVSFAGDSPTVDVAAGYPYALDFEPTAVAEVSQGRVVVVGESEGRAVVRRYDVSVEPPGEEGPPELTDGWNGVPVSVTGDGLGNAFILLDSGDVWMVGVEPSTGDDDDSAGDDDDSGTDDDDSGTDDDDSGTDDDDSGTDDDDAANDDDSGADDDDSANDDDSGPNDDDSGSDDDDSAQAGADAGDFFPTLLLSGGPTPAADIAWSNDGKSGVVYVLGGNSVVMIDEDGADLGSLSIGSNGSALAASGDDYAYAIQGETGQMSILAAGPWIRMISDDSVSLISSTDTVDVTFETTLGVVGDATCDYALYAGGDIDASGTLITSATGSANDGETVTLTLTGADLVEGNHRVFIFCTDAEGDTGRASFAYYFGELDAPSSFTATAGEATVSLSWTDLSADTVSKYIIYFDTGSFDSDVIPVTCTEDTVTCSPLDVPRITTVEADDDDSASDDDDATTTSTGGTIRQTMSDLTNGVTWYFSVAAADEDGNIGPRTAVLSATPSVLGGAAALSGDQGCSCGSSFGPAATPLLFLLPLIARRRRSHR